MTQPPTTVPPDLFSVTPPQELILPLLQEVFGTQVRLAQVELIKHQRDYRVVIAHLEEPRQAAVIKLAGPQATLASDFDRAAAIYRLVATGTDIPMPEIWLVDVSCRRWPWRCLVRSHIPGQVFAQVRPRLAPSDLATAYRQIGNAVGQLHSLRFPAYGSITAQGSVRDQGALLPALQAHARNILPEREKAEYFLSVLETRSELFTDGQACLCHEDLHHYNLLFAPAKHGWRLATILDFEKAWAGPAESDLARLELWRGMTSPEFWQTYTDVQPVDPFYRERRPVYQLLWCLEFPSHSPQHRADTEQVCLQLGVQMPPW